MCQCKATLWIDTTVYSIAYHESFSRFVCFVSYLICDRVTGSRFFANLSSDWLSYHSSTTMASTSTSSSGPSLPVVFSTQTPYRLPSQKFMIPASWKRYQLSQLVNKALSLVQPVPFDFLVRGEILRTTLADWCAENGVGEVCVVRVLDLSSVLIFWCYFAV